MMAIYDTAGSKHRTNEKPIEKQKKNRNDVRVQSTQTHDNDVYVTLNNKLTTEFIWMYLPIWDTPYKCEK